jgi:hypothetical protein
MRRSQWFWSFESRRRYRQSATACGETIGSGPAQKNQRLRQANGGEYIIAHSIDDLQRPGCCPRDKRWEIEMAAVIDPPSLPLYLYRYRGLAKFKRELAAVTTPYIYCGKFDKLNDPMEGFYRPSTTLKNKTDYDRVADLIYANKLNIGIASMSDTYENELMWTHYAGNYSGICIEFYSDRLKRALPKNSHLVRMGYADQLPRISGNDARDHTAAARRFFRRRNTIGITSENGVCSGP